MLQITVSKQQSGEPNMAILPPHPTSVPFTVTASLGTVGLTWLWQEVAYSKHNILCSVLAPQGWCFSRKHSLLFPFKDSQSPYRKRLHFVCFRQVTALMCWADKGRRRAIGPGKTSGDTNLQSLNRMLYGVTSGCHGGWRSFWQVNTLANRGNHPQGSGGCWPYEADLLLRLPVSAVCAERAEEGSRVQVSFGTELPLRPHQLTGHGPRPLHGQSPGFRLPRAWLLAKAISAGSWTHFHFLPARREGVKLAQSIGHRPQVDSFLRSWRGRWAGLCNMKPRRALTHFASVQLG